MDDHLRDAHALTHETRSIRQDVERSIDDMEKRYGFEAHRIRCSRDETHQVRKRFDAMR